MEDLAGASTPSSRVCFLCRRHLGAVLWGILLVVEMMPADAFTEPFTGNVHPLSH